MSEKSIAKARAVVMLYNKEKEDWECSGGLEGIATVHIYHHPVNNTYRIVGRLEKDQPVVLNFALVKGLSYQRKTTSFHQWTDQSQLYGLNFVSKQDAQVFGNGVFTSLENLKTTGSTGLAFSGGGIRSAAFCSGVLSRLLNDEVEVDYLSCVSGGGFTGTAYLDWKYREEKEQGDERRPGEGMKGWHKDFFNNMTQRSGYICDWTGYKKGCCDAILFIFLMLAVLVLPAIKWLTYAFPVALMIDLFGIGNLMRKSADCDAALERQREMNKSAVPGNDVIDRCLSGSHKSDITIFFSVFFFVFGLLYVLISKTKKFFLEYPSALSVLLLLEYAVACVLIFTFIPFTIYDFFVKIPVWAQVLVGILVVFVWVVIPFLRRKTSFVLIVLFYSFVIYWRVFRVDVPLLSFLKHEDHVSHWLLFASGIALMTSSFTTNLKDELVHRYFRWRVQKAFYHENSNTEPLTLADLQDTKPEYISNIVVNRWKNNDEDKNNYALLTMSPSGIERFGWREKNQFKGKVEPKDIMLSEAMSISAATLSKHMGKYDDSIEGLTRLHTILGLDMGARMISDAGRRKKCPRQLLTWLFDFVLGSLLIIPTICYNHGRKHFEPSLLGCMITFLVVHAILVVIAVLDSVCNEGCCRCVRWFTVHNSFVYNVRLLFSMDTIGSIPPTVLQLSDGGHYENLALLPLLQRKLKRIVVVDGGYKDEEEDYGKSILDAMMLARTELKCSFYDEDGKDVISGLMQTFVNPSKENEKPRYYKFKVHYGGENNSDSECDGEIIILVPRKSEDIQSMGLTCGCCDCCHWLTKCCHGLSSCLCNEFPQHSTINQFFTPKLFSVYHQEGRRACEEAKADEFLKTVCSANDVRDKEPKRPAIPSLVGTGSSKDNETPLSDIKIE